MASPISVTSYPPIFRPTQQADLVSDPSDHPVDYTDPLPVIDMAHLDEAKLHAVCSDWGVFRLVNHGIPEDLITRLLSTAKSLFDLPFESKRAIFTGSNPGYTWGNRALTSSRVQTPTGLPEVGLENISFALARSCHQEPQDTAIIAFRNIMEEYGAHMTILAKGLFKAMAKNLNLADESFLAKDDFNNYLDLSTGALRVNRYPPHCTSDVSSEVKDLGAHTDSSVLTFLLNDDVYGLEIFRNGLWLPVKPIHNTLVVNIGDLLKAMSDDEYKSVEHRVKLNKVRDRFSVGYFVFPEDNTLLSGSKGKYRPFTCKEFRAQVEDDVAKFGWKVGLSRFLA